MVGFPMMMCYFAMALTLHEGHFFFPSEFTAQGIKEWFVTEIIEKGIPAIMPNLKATKIYMGYVAFSFVLAYTMPGPVVYGLPIPSLKAKRVSGKRIMVI